MANWFTEEPSIDFLTLHCEFYVRFLNKHVRIIASYKTSIIDQVCLKNSRPFNEKNSLPKTMAP